MKGEAGWRGNRETLLTFGDNSEVNTSLSANHYRSHSCRNGRVGCKTRKKKDRNKTRNIKKKKRSRIGKEGEVKERNVL
jgi:hypothetical protein